MHVRRADDSAGLCLGEARPGEAMRDDHVMSWLSAGKPLTAIAVAQLWEQGAVGLDDRVAEHVPEFGARGKEPITLRHVLTHTAGFRSLFDLEPAPLPWDEALRKVCAARLERGWQPGRRAGYQARSGWHVLGEVVQRLTGEELAGHVRRSVLAPCGMEHTWLAVPEAQYEAVARRSAQLLDTSGDAPRPDEALGGEVAAVRCAPGASARGPMSDLSRLYAAMLVAGAGRHDGLLSPTAVAAMTAAHRVGLEDESFRHVIDWGLGFALDSNRYGADTVPYGFGRHSSPRAFGHGGSQCCMGFADPDHGLAAALAVNGRPGEPRHQSRFRRALTALYEDLQLTPDDVERR